MCAHILLVQQWRLHYLWPQYAKRLQLLDNYSWCSISNIHIALLVVVLIPLVL